MPDLIHPETGQHTHASISTAKTLLDEGWKLLGGEEPQDAAEPNNTTDDESGKQEPKTAPGAASTEKPLDKLKLTELIAHAEKIGVPAEQIEPLRKPGASKAQAIEIIENHTAS